MTYTKEDLNQLINVKLNEVPRKVLNDIFGYKDPKTLARKISGEMPLTPIDQMNIDVLSDSADAGVRHLYRRESLQNVPNEQAYQPLIPEDDGRDSFCECGCQKDHDCKYCTTCNKFESV